MVTWQQSKLGQIGNIQSGSGFPKKYQGESSGDYPFYKVSDMNLLGNEVRMLNANNYISIDVRDQLRAFVLPKDTIIFPKVGAAVATNKKRILTKDSCIDNNVMGLTPSLDLIYPDFLYYWFQQHDLSAFANHAHLPSIKKTTVEDWNFSYPSIPEQQRIVAILDQAFADIEKARVNAEQNLKNARELFDSYFHQAFALQSENAALVRLDTLYKIARGGSPRPIKDFITEDSNGINWIKIGDATASGKYIYSTKQKIKPEGMQRSRLVKEGDFILSNSMSFGRPYIMATSGCIHDGWLVLSAKDNRVDQDFLYHLLGSPFAFNQFNSLAAGSTVRNLNIDLVSGVEIPLLPISEQRELVVTLDDLSSKCLTLESTYETKLKSLDELKKSLLQKAFSGELTKSKGIAA